MPNQLPTTAFQLRWLMIAPAAERLQTLVRLPFTMTRPSSHSFAQDLSSRLDHDGGIFKVNVMTTRIVADENAAIIWSLFARRHSSRVTPGGASVRRVTRRAHVGIATWRT